MENKKFSSHPKIEDSLKSAGVGITPGRILVYKCLDASPYPLSLAEIEDRLESVDKSTVSRTLTKFREKHIIHAFNDGSGSMKYEICHSSNIKSDSDLHVHFRCEKCGLTKCLLGVKIPVINLPEGYTQNGYNYVVSGICADCNINCNIKQTPE